MALTPGTRLGSYEVLSQLGRGGMGVVYTARDARLDRVVAIKFLPPHSTDDEVAKRRFLIEARAASALDHPNICTIYEIDETPDGELYLVMAYYEGETLKQKLARGSLGIDEAVDLASQVGLGLSRAHAAGIAHRDIKPANLIVTPEGVVKILDFGLAKLAGADGVTESGTTVGTVAYMSPEQARGKAIDYRTDIWSLGVVFYEMLAGRTPFSGENLVAMSRAIVKEPPAPLRGLRPDVPPSIEAAVNRALHKEASGRHQSAADFVSALRGAVASPAKTIVLASRDVADAPSIAVLPFANMSADPDQEYFCDGLTEELMDALARLDGLRVVARTSAFQFKGQAHDLRRVGEQLNVTSVLEGSVRKSGARLRINAQLINAADGYHVWSERYDRDMDDVFAVQDEIARAVVETLKVRLLKGSGASIVRRPTDDLDAYALYLRGRYQWNRLQLQPALDHFRQAIARDPAYAPAHVAVAQCYIGLGWHGSLSPRDAFPNATASARTALQIDDSLAEAHATLGYVATFHDWDWDGAARELNRALALNPNSPSCHLFQAWFLNSQGRHDEAIASVRLACELDPLSMLNQSNLAYLAYFARRDDEAIAYATRTLELDASFGQARSVRALPYVQQGAYDLAIADLLDEALEADDPIRLGRLGYTYARAGRPDDAQQVLARLMEPSTRPYVVSTEIARVYAGLDEPDEAFTWLESAWHQREAHLAYLNVDPHFDTLRNDPRFQDLLRRMNFVVEQTK